MSSTFNPKDLLGIKKPQVDLVPGVLLLHTAKAMENGAKKYGPYNWRQTNVNMSIYIAAAMRHLLALQDGEDIAGDSGVHHCGHVAACMAIILDAREGGWLNDDRPRAGPVPRTIERLTSKGDDVPGHTTEGDISHPSAVIPRPYYPSTGGPIYDVPHVVGPYDYYTDPWVSAVTVMRPIPSNIK